MSILDEVSLRLAHSLSRRIGLTKEQIVSLALCRLIFELGQAELFETAINVQNVLVRITPALGLGEIESELQAVKNVLSYIETISESSRHSSQVGPIIEEIITTLSHLQDKLNG